MLTKPKQRIIIRGMHGMGDCLHQRALLRQLIDNNYEVWLTSSWVAMYHDLIQRGLRVCHRVMPLRTQKKNAEREKEKFCKDPMPIGGQIQIRYSAQSVGPTGNILKGMFSCLDRRYGLDYSKADFRLPIPNEWLERIDKLIADWKPTKPILIFRPLVLRREHISLCEGRNPDHVSFFRLYRDMLRDKYFVVSIADLLEGVEWLVGESADTDVQLHRGELEFESLAALFSRASLVYCSPGFSVPLAQAVMTPVICVFGGYENSSSFMGGLRFSPYLGIDPVKPQYGFSHRNVDKTIDIPGAIKKIEEFLDAIAGYQKEGSFNPRQMDIPAEALSA